jgi:hypothetical protein
VAGRPRPDRRHREDRARRGGAELGGRRGGRLTRAASSILLTAFAIGACGRREVPPPPPPAPPAFTEAPLETSGAAAFVVGPIRETRSADGQKVFIEGTVENVGTRTSRSLKVWVNALDADGLRRERVEALPTPQDVAPGTVAHFVVQLADDPLVRTYHVEAVGR